MDRLRELFMARARGVVEEMPPADAPMYAGNEQGYLDAGHRALMSVRLALLAARKRRVDTILDLGSGHGRVLRQLRAEFPDARLFACDVSRDAVDYCVRVLGAEPVYSSRPSELRIEGEFDLIYIGSLLTHLDVPDWQAVIGLCRDVLAPRGVLVFTVQGRAVAARIEDGRRLYGMPEATALELVREYERDGFAYRDWPDQTGYGLALSKPSWVCSFLERFRELQLVAYTEERQDAQDVVAVFKRPAGEAAGDGEA